MWTRPNAMSYLLLNRGGRWIRYFLLPPNQCFRIYICFSIVSSSRNSFIHSKISRTDLMLILCWFKYVFLKLFRKNKAIICHWGNFFYRWYQHESLAYKQNSWCNNSYAILFHEFRKHFLKHLFFSFSLSIPEFLPLFVKVSGIWGKKYETRKKLTLPLNLHSQTVVM